MYRQYKKELSYGDIFYKINSKNAKNLCHFKNGDDTIGFHDYTLICIDFSFIYNYNWSTSRNGLIITNGLYNIQQESIIFPAKSPHSLYFLVWLTWTET